jgi:TonB family protein
LKNEYTDMSTSASQEGLFSLLPRTRTPWAEFVFSTGAQALAIAALIGARLLTPVVSPVDFSFRPVVLVSTPAPVNHQPQPVTRIQFAEKTPAASPILTLPAPTAQPKIVAKVEEAPAPKVTITPQKMNLAERSNPVIPKQGVMTNVFSTGSSATPTIARAPSQVQTGGFGDPNGIPAKAGQDKRANIGVVGSFDLPSGAGYGNGTGGGKGASGVVANAGFGNGTAIPDPRPRSSQSTVQASGFTNANTVPAPVAHAHASEEAAKMVPAEIVFKPVPAYTQEARALRIEGEVLLEVVFEAAGSLRVLRVVSGLGHGLDDNAIKAAQQIRFKPALRDGRPADSTALVHIIFQMA